MLPSPETNSEFTPENGWLEDDEILLEKPGKLEFSRTFFREKFGCQPVCFWLAGSVAPQGWLPGLVAGCQGWFAPHFFEALRKKPQRRSFTYDYCFSSLEPTNDTGTQEKVYADLGVGGGTVTVGGWAPRTWFCSVVLFFGHLHS